VTDCVREPRRRIKPLKVLVAPSWGSQGLIESGVATTLIGVLIDAGFAVTLRPHPQTARLSSDRVAAVCRVFQNSQNFAFESNVAS
jgi:hypothetical protein